MSCARSVVASLVLLAAGWLASQRGDARARCVLLRAMVAARAQASAPVLRPPPGGLYRDLEFASMRVDSLELPHWFGAPRLPRVRIAGKVFGAHPVTTVRLALAVPEPGIWPGRVVAVEPDGSFDFGPMRAGSYQLIAYGGDRTSSWTAIDTITTRGDQVELYAAPCHPLHGWFWTTSDRNSQDAVPAVGVAVELAGWVLGVTDASGAYDVCVPDVTDDAKLRVAGFADPPLAYRSDGHHHRLLWPEHREAGFVIGADGAPAVKVGVQPIWRTEESPSACRESTLVETTDGTGRFTYNAAHPLCGFRIWRGPTTHDAAFEPLRFDAPQVIALPASGHELRRFD